MTVLRLKEVPICDYLPTLDSIASKMQSRLYLGYIDVGDGCWRPNVLVTS